MKTPRYIIADPDEGCGWGHIFDDSQIERMTRFVFDRVDRRLVYLDVQRNHNYRAGSPTDIADLEDSLINANEDALANPSTWSLIESNELPSWFVPNTDHPTSAGQLDESPLDDISP